MPGAMQPLLGSLRVLELGHFIAAPFCTRVLADLGADVIDVQPPGGDPVRGWGLQRNGRSIWWSVHGRNKRCITLEVDPQYQARHMVTTAEDPLHGPLLHPGVVPMVEGLERDAQIRWTGPPVGHHNGEVYEKLLGYSRSRISELQEKGIL